MYLHLHDALRQYFGFPVFRPGQAEALNHVLSGRDTLVVMPTGAGKSLIYQLAALLLPDTTLVISPLVALMKDQIDSMSRRDIAATFINSSLDPFEQSERLYELATGRYKIVLVAPERLRNAAFREALTHRTIGLLVVDEAHCLSQWGHDFRPDYLHIVDARRELQIPQTLALTATATPQVQDDIVRLLDVPSAVRLITGFNRPNLAFDVLKAPGIHAKRSLLHTALYDTEGAGLIYTGTRRDTEEVAAFVRTSVGLEARHYHGGLDPVLRAETQDAFLTGQLPVIVATNAFGMGIDRPDVRLVVHYAIPGTLEAYYQEAGRAGRDGLPARALLLYAPKDVSLQEFFIENDSPSAAELRRVHQVLCSRPGIKVETLETATGLSQVKTRVALEQLLRAGALYRVPGQFRFETLALEEEALQTVAAEVAARRIHKHAQLRKMVHYARMQTCRRRALLEHFGDTGPADAPQCCDNCTARQRARPGAADATRLVTAPMPPEHAALAALDTLVHVALELSQSKLLQFLHGAAAPELVHDRQEQNPTAVVTLRLADLDALIDTLVDAGYLQHVAGDRPTIQLTPSGVMALQTRAAPPGPLQPAPAEVLPPRRTTRRTAGGAALTGEQLASGLTPEQIAAARGLTIGTIYAHLAQLIAAGRVDVNAVVAAEAQAQIRAAIAHVGSIGYLAPIKALLPVEMSYDAIRCVVAAWRRERRRTTAAAPPPAITASSPGVLRDLPVEPLRRWRRAQAAALGQPDFALFGTETLHQLARRGPQTQADLHSIAGLRAEVIASYGQEIRTVINTATSSEMIDAILACVRALPGALPRSGVANLLVGSSAERLEKFRTHPLYNRLERWTRSEVLLQVDVLLELGVLRQDEKGYLVLVEAR